MTSEVFFVCYCCSIRSEWSFVQAAPWHTFSSVFLAWPEGPRTDARVNLQQSYTANASDWTSSEQSANDPRSDNAADVRACGEAICHARCHGEDEKTVPSVDDFELGEEPLGSVYTPGAGVERGGWRRLGVNGDNRDMSNQLQSTSSTYHANLFQTVLFCIENEIDTAVAIYQNTL